MARDIDFENLDDDDIEYLKQRHWIIEEAELQGVQGVRELIQNHVPGQYDEEEEDDEEEEISYEEASVEDLKAELKERGLSASGSKADLVARLEEDDAKDDEEE
jgi:hypothetical protein